MLVVFQALARHQSSLETWGALPLNPQAVCVGSSVAGGPSPIPARSKRLCRKLTLRIGLHSSICQVTSPVPAQFFRLSSSSSETPGHCCKKLLKPQNPRKG